MKNEILLDEQTKIVLLDDLNYSLQFARKSEKKGIVWVNEGYYPSLISLCESYIDTHPLRSDKVIDSLEKLIDCIKEAKETLIKAIK